jgi:hypothetical protein
MMTKVILWSAIAALAVAMQAAAGEEPAPAAKLPEGDTGIAAKYPGDAGIAKDPEVILAEDFEKDGADMKAAFGATWNEVKNPAIMSLVGDVPEGSPGKKALLVTHEGGKSEGMHLYKSFKPGFDQVFLRFYVKIDPDCNPVHHFVHMGGYNPPTNWPQGGAGVRPDGSKNFSTAVEPHGDAWRWDYYSYWMEMGGSPPKGQTWGNSFIREGAPPVEKGKWTCLELMAKMNKVGESDGEQALWVNGKLVSHLGKGFPKGLWIFDKFNPGKGGKGVRWSDEKAGPDYFEIPEGGAPFEGFRWRSSDQLQLNYLWLLVYITGAPDGKISKIWFDDLVFAKSYVGPLAKPKAANP